MMLLRASAVLHNHETLAYGDAGYKGTGKKADKDKSVSWQIPIHPDKRKTRNRGDPADALIEKAENLKMGIRVKVEHLFQMTKRQFDFVKVRYRGLRKNAAQVFPIFAVSSLWTVRGKLVGGKSWVRARKPGDGPGRGLKSPRQSPKGRDFWRLL